MPYVYEKYTAGDKWPAGGSGYRTGGESGANTMSTQINDNFAMMNSVAEALFLINKAGSVTNAEEEHKYIRWDEFGVVKTGSASIVGENEDATNTTAMWHTGSKAYHLRKVYDKAVTEAIDFTTLWTGSSVTNASYIYVSGDPGGIRIGGIGSIASHGAEIRTKSLNIQSGPYFTFGLHLRPEGGGTNSWISGLLIITDGTNDVTIWNERSIATADVSGEMWCRVKTGSFVDVLYNGSLVGSHVDCSSVTGDWQLKIIGSLHQYPAASAYSDIWIKNVCIGHTGCSYYSDKIGSVTDTSKLIRGALINKDDTLRNSDTITYKMSANSGTNWTTFTPGESKRFTVAGSELRVRADFNYNNGSPETSFNEYQVMWWEY